MTKKLFGDKRFYKRVVLLMLPILLQNGITNFVNMLDNLMVGQVGQTEMIGVSVANQLMFVFNLCVFGAVSGAGIFGAQFFGNSDHKGVRDTFRFKLVFCTALAVGAIGLFLLYGTELINMYLEGEGTEAEILASLKAGEEYLKVMLIGLIPAAIVQCYYSTLRETGQTLPPMVAGITAVLVNLLFNYMLIFGNWGAPKLGVTGAAIATVISRFAELAVIAVWTELKRNTESNRFIIGAYRSMRVPMKLVKSIASKGMPLMLNETMWAAGIALVNKNYSDLGLDVVAADNVVQTFFNLFSVAFMAVGVSIGIIVGQLLGAGKEEEAKSQAVKLITFSVLVSITMAVLFAVCAEFIPDFYKIDDNVKLLATRMMQICAISMPLDAFAHATYFTLRSGGEAFITILFDSGFVWAISVPASSLLCNYSGMTILPIYAICQGLHGVKCMIGAYFVKKGKWVKRIVD